MEFRVLGPLEVRAEGGAIEVGGAKLRGLLAVLLLHANESVSAERLAVELWGQEAPPGAVKAIQVYVSRLRQALGDPQSLVTTPAGYRLQVAPGELDCERFEQLAAEGHRALADGDPELARQTLRDALSLWRGPALEEFAFEAFAQAEIRRLEEERLAALEARVEADLAVGRHAELVGELQQLVAEHPLRERLHAQLMLALYRGGRQADALQAYREARATLVDELGVEPGIELRDLERAILGHDPRLIRLADASAGLVGEDDRSNGASDDARRALPSGTVTFAFTDVEGSTRLVCERPEDYGRLLAEHQPIVRNAFQRHGGVEISADGDALFYVFASAAGAAAAAGEAQAGLEGGPIRVRMGLHTGEAVMNEGNYVGFDIHRAARICAAAHGGQVLLSEATRELIGEEAHDLGSHRLKDLPAPERLFQLGPALFPRRSA